MNPIPDDPLWFKKAIIYQLHVRAFYDADADGIGDFRGLIEKLDYLADLGVTALWLLPFYPSPLRDDGYDIADYYTVNPSYGTLDDFKEFLDKAHAHGLRVITELVINHTSDQHTWFQRARKAPAGSEHRAFYVWSDAPDRYLDARIIFKDFEHSNWAYDPVAKAYYWHRFYSHQPDLNFDNPAVQAAVFEMLDFWLGMGVDGLRLDAVPYLFEREGTNCENLPETHAFLRKLRAHIDARFQNRMLLAEANQWPEDAVSYFGRGDECHMNFHFPLMPRMFMAVQMEDRFPIIDILDQTPAIPANCQWATFLRNHDELTLEMVTDEERDYMWRVYAADPRARINLGIRRRLAPLLANSRRKIELMNTLLLSLPGTPIIYYGDEIGMGDNFYLGDRHGVRTPMQWSADRNAGFSRANPQQLYLPVVIDPEHHFEAVNVETQEKNLTAMLWWMRRVIAMRKKFAAFGGGTIEFLLPDNSKVLAFLQKHETQTMLVLANLSRFAQPVEIDLSAYEGMVPVEVFSRNKFPAIKRAPYFFTLAPYDHCWLALEAAAPAVQAAAEYAAPFIDAEPSWEKLLAEPQKTVLEREILPAWLQNSRWFGGKAREPRQVRIVESFPSGDDERAARIAFVEVSYADAQPQVYLVPLQIASGENALRLLADSPRAIVARFRGDGGDSVLHDAVYDEHFRAGLLRTIIGGRRISAGAGSLVGCPAAELNTTLGHENLSLGSRLLKVEQSNSAIVYESRLFLKLYRQLEDGTNPDAELMRFLSERQKFAHVPGFCGTIEYQRPRAEPRVLGLLVAHVANEGDAWSYTLDSLGRYFERVLARKADLAGTGDAELLAEVIGGVYPERARLLARRTGEMHLALASATDDEQFAPEPFTTFAQRSLYQAMRNATRRMVQLVQKKIRDIPKAYRKEVADVPGFEAEILKRQARVGEHRIAATKSRTHGDYHLGQVLYTGSDFVIIDFEGEPARSLKERKAKRSPLRDVAGMIRSFHYAAYAALRDHPALRGEDAAFVEPWAEAWAHTVGQIFLDAYLETVAGASFIPAEPEDLKILLEAHLLEKAAYEVTYELNNRPDWVVIPVRGIRSILGA
jgi:maltose alpha-D-glucosyltransferase / alpha-amylase